MSKKISPYAVALLGIYLLTAASCGEPEPQKQPEKKLPETAEVLSDNLKVRMAPNTMAAEIGRLQTGSEVKLLSRSTDRVKIGAMQEHWYQVQTEGGLRGWVYGAYLSVNESALQLAKEGAEKRNKKLREYILGRWYATKKSGALRTLFITLFSNGEIEMGYRKKTSHEGTYELKYAGNRVTVEILEMKKDRKPLVTNIVGELRGETFILKGDRRSSTYNFTLTDKSPETFSEEKKKELEKKKKTG